MAYISSNDSSARPGHRLAPRPLLVHYGPNCLDLLPFRGLLALQPDQVDDRQLATLLASGVEPMAYLSLGEDTGEAAPWQRSRRNPDWGGCYVTVGHPGWQRRVLHLAQQHLARGFAGLLLDTLDAVQVFPGDRPAMLGLVRSLRRAHPGCYLLANRGFDMLPEMVPHADGLLFESFSAVWTRDGYQPLPESSLAYNAQVAAYLRTTGLDLYSLDYADDPALAHFAIVRAVAHGMAPLTGNRELTEVQLPPEDLVY